MPLSTFDKAKAAVMAVVVLKDYTQQQLEKLQEQLSTREQQADFALGLQESLATALACFTPEVRVAYCEEITRRICLTVDTRLAA